MKILVANLGSTSFKFRLFDMSDERQLARGGVERIGEVVSVQVLARPHDDVESILKLKKAGK